MLKIEWVIKVLLLTSSRQDTVDSTVTNRSFTGLNIHVEFSAYSHEYPLLQTQLYKKNLETIKQKKFER